MPNNPNVVAPGRRSPFSTKVERLTRAGEAVQVVELLTQIGARVDELDKRMDALEDKTAAAVDKVDNRVDQLGRSMTQQFGRVHSTLTATADRARNAHAIASAARKEVRSARSRLEEHIRECGGTSDRTVDDDPSRSIDLETMETMQAGHGEHHTDVAQYQSLDEHESPAHAEEIAALKDLLAARDHEIEVLKARLSQKKAK